MSEDSTGQGKDKVSVFRARPAIEGVGPESTAEENNWVRSNRRHNEALALAKERFGGETFARAPFGLIDKGGRFIEVKVARYRHHLGAHQWRVVLTREQVRFSRLKPMHLYVVWGESVSLIPMEKWTGRLGHCSFQRTSFKGVDRWSTVFEIPSHDLDEYIIHGLPKNLKALLREARSRNSWRN